MSESTLRQIQLLELLPRYPSKKTSRQLKLDLQDLGYKINMRMIQRDLEFLESILPLNCDDRERPFGWSWHKSAQGVQPLMDPIEALTFSLAKEYLKPILPSHSFNRMKIFFERANKVLEEVDRNEISHWRKRVRVDPQWQYLLAPQINEEVESVIYHALLKQKQLEVAYLNRGSKKAKKRIVNPLGLTLRGSINYLICTMDEDTDNPRFLPLHRFKKAKLSGEKSKEAVGFSMDNYLKDNNLGFLLSKQKLKVDLVFRSGAGFHLTETPLSKDQKLINKKDGSIRVKATLADTSQLRWWLLGFGSQVEILGPKFLRKEIAKTAGETYRMYGNKD